MLLEFIMLGAIKKKKEEAARLVGSTLRVSTHARTHTTRVRACEMLSDEKREEVRERERQREKEGTRDTISRRVGGTHDDGETKQNHVHVARNTVL